MDNNLPYVNSFEELYWQYDYNLPNYLNSHLPVSMPLNRAPKVLVNPNFKPSCKVYVNPLFSGTLPASDYGGVSASVSNVISDIPYSTKIHINPNIQRSQIRKTQTIHVNPKFAQESLTQCIPQAKEITTVVPKKIDKFVILSKTKLVRNSNYNTPSKSTSNRRNSIKSKYKIIKTGLSPVQKIANKMTINSRIKQRFKIDNRQLQIGHKNKMSPSKILIKPRVVIGLNKSIVYINGIAFKKSVSSLRRSKSITSSPNKTIKSTPKKVNSEVRERMVKKSKTVRKLKKCNIPCPTYRKYGVCKGNIQGKCSLKHDPNQIALCTRFLQGACIKAKCYLSHNVSPEKMPTCKYYLEGSCTKENCPYLHVKISAKAEICREFLEGYCKKGAECYKRHQYLCPDYEKYGECIKPRCLYPHGHLVRPYLINNDKFAKNYPGKTKEKKLDNPKKVEDNIEKKRYYIDKECELNVVENCKKTEDLVDLRVRPKLGVLPAFIPFQDS